ncbi:acetylornithine transaminase [Heterostelium album PN500]|uniref:acetylornithine transaminase n=1 Tax=Heterostelium pallidum (strain ATCC 26659 / Pp 5 / PN500) TaxID=670386 RepID=D3BGV8_HETP5|nr:acetylornithine transaminase [Heterostelium album PN500]EFA79342.1 acetylornithine transaminase [Heterostelium album PN500]|eukprot:XP_020431463.1 acetylornithine transaminase [Heterostelium album PN500]
MISRRTFVTKKDDILSFDAGNDTDKLIELHNRVIMNTYARVPGIVLSHGKNAAVFDLKGTEYLDMGAGIAVNALGHNDAGLVKTIAEQSAKLIHTSNLYYNAPAIRLAQQLIGNSALDKVFFANTGTEANEGALKFARKHGLQSSPDKYEIVAFTHGFSGRSMGALSVTHKSKYREIYGPLVPGIKFATYNDIESMRAAIGPNTCGVIVEPVQGEGGLEAATPEFMQALAEQCKKNNALLIVDEVQCGLGRTGELWAHERLGVKPDIMTLAKPLAGGMAIGAILVRDHVAGCINPGDHGTTFGGSPLVTQAGLYVFQKIVQPAFLEEVRAKGRHLKARLQAIADSDAGRSIKEIRTVGGLFVGIEFDHAVKDLVNFAVAAPNHVFFISAGDNTLRLCPPLTISTKDLDRACDVIEAYLKKYNQQSKKQ